MHHKNSEEQTNWFNILYLIVWIQTQICVVKTDEALLFIKQHTTFLNNPPRNLHQYIKQFLHRHISRIFVTKNILFSSNRDKDFKMVLKPLLNLSEKFIFHSKLFSYLKMFWEREIETCSGEIGISYQQVLRVACPPKCQRNCLKSPQETIQTATCKIWQKSLQFSLDKKLSLNISFAFIRFTSSHQKHCVYGSLKVIGKSQATDAGRTKAIFCGRHPSFISLQNWNFLNLTIRFYFYDFHEIQFHYQVYTFDLIALVAGAHLLHPPSECKVYQFPSQRSMLQIVHLKTMSHHRLFLDLTHLDSAQYVSYNGPGIKSNRIKTSAWSNIVHTETFQCVFYITMKEPHTGNMHDKVKNLLNFQSQKLPSELLKAVQIEHGTETHLFDVSLNKSKIFGFQYISDSTMQINITIIHLLYHGRESQSCKYGGLSIGESLGGRIPTLVCRCDIFNSKSFVSTNSSAILVAYSYPEYSSLAASLVVSPTQCRVISVSVCQFTELCDGRDDLACSLLLSNLTNNSVLHLTPHGDVLDISMKKESCAVVQLSSGETREELLTPRAQPTCRTRFSISKILLPGMNMTLWVRGSFQRDNYQRTNSFGAKGNADSVGWWQNTKPYWQCNSWLGIHDTEGTFTYMYTLISPVIDYGLSFKIDLNPVRSYNWLDINILFYSMTKATTAEKGHENELYFGQMLHFQPSKPRSKCQCFLTKRILVQEAVLLKLEMPVLGRYSEMFLKSIAKSQINQRELRWTSHYLPFHFDKMQHVISLPGQICEMTIELRTCYFRQTWTDKGVTNVQIKLIWVVHADINEHQCSKSCNFSSSVRREMLKMFYFDKCISCSSKKQHQKEYITFLRAFIVPRKYNYLSWLKASTICRILGGHLPVFHSKKQEEELVKIIKLSSLTEALFIGLSFSPTQQVM